MHIGTRIKQLMKEKKVSTKEMAAYCGGVTPGAVSNWFATGRISKENVMLAAELLKVSTDELITGVFSHEESKPKQPLVPVFTARPAIETGAHSIQSIEQACSTLAGYMDSLTDTDREVAAGWLAGLARRPESAKHVIGALTDMISANVPGSRQQSTGNPIRWAQRDMFSTVIYLQDYKESRVSRWN